MRKHVSNSKESPNSIREEFQIVPKKLYGALTGKHYDPGVKLTKAEKAQTESQGQAEEAENNGHQRRPEGQGKCNRHIRHDTHNNGHKRYATTCQLR